MYSPFHIFDFILTRWAITWNRPYKMQHHDFMSSALTSARQAFDKGEVPIGAVIVCNNQIIASAFNTCEADHDALAHAELKVIREAAHIKNNWRLDDCDLYVTLEPCPMCLGALFQTRIRRLIFGCTDHKRSFFPSLKNITSLTDNNHTIEIVGGVMEAECSKILKDFFRSRRGAASCAQ